jgi:hypothetical protein
MKLKRLLILLLLSVLITGCGATPDTQQPTPVIMPSDTSAPTVSGVDSNPHETGSPVTIKAEVWADNWFAFYSGEQLIQEDSVSITTERSFNSETFTFEAVYPLTLNFVAKDFKENDTGLEYIGTNRQQMGDGGLIAQFTEASTGQIIAVTNSNWMCMVIHEAPLDKACENSSNPVPGVMPCGFTITEEPANWKAEGFDSSAWSPATIYTAKQVGPKDGYDQISWNPSAQFIWGPDLETNNTILCRLTVTK